MYPLTHTTLSPDIFCLLVPKYYFFKKLNRRTDIALLQVEFLKPCTYDRIPHTTPSNSLMNSVFHCITPNLAGLFQKPMQ